MSAVTTRLRCLEHHDPCTVQQADALLLQRRVCVCMYVTTRSLVGCGGCESWWSRCLLFPKARVGRVDLAGDVLELFQHKLKLMRKHVDKVHRRDEMRGGGGVGTNE